MNDVVAVAGFAKDGDFHIFEQADVLAFEVRGFGSFDHEDGAIGFDFFEAERGETLFFALRERGGSVFRFATSDPEAMHIDGAGEAGKGEGQDGGPAGVSSRIASIHEFSKSKIAGSV